MTEAKIRIVTDYVIANKSPVVVHREDGFYCVKLGAWLEAWHDNMEAAEDHAYDLAKIELVPIVWNAGG